MTTNQPEPVETRLTRLESLFANVGETVLAQNDAIAALGVSVQQTTQNVDVLRETVNTQSASIQQITQNVNGQSGTIDVLVANIQQLTENVTTVTNRVDDLAIQAEQDRAQAAQDRQQTAIDRQAWQAEIRRIWEYLLGQQPGNGRGGQDQ